MKSKIRLNRRIARRDGRIDQLEQPSHLPKILIAALFGGNGRRFDFDSQPKLEHVLDVGQGSSLIRNNAEGLARSMIGHVYPRTLTADDQPFGTQRGHGFPNDRAANSKLRIQLLLSRQFLAAGEAAGADLSRKPLGQLGRSTGRRGKKRNWRAHHNRSERTANHM